jgi:hypothetical protein
MASCLNFNFSSVQAVWALCSTLVLSLFVITGPILQSHVIPIVFLPAVSSNQIKRDLRFSRRGVRRWLSSAPCSPVEVYRRFRGHCCLHHQGDECPDDGGSKDLWNVCKLLPLYTGLQPRIQLTSNQITRQEEIWSAGTWIRAHKREDNIKIDLKVVGRQDLDRWRSLANTAVIFGFHKRRKMLDSQEGLYPLK